MKVKKVLNNNVVLAEDEHQQEIIVMGNAIGYKYKNEDEMDAELIEKKFLLMDTAVKQNFMNMLLSSSPQHISLCNDIIRYGETVLQLPLSDCIFVTLLDHLNFALQR